MSAVLVALVGVFVVSALAGIIVWPALMIDADNPPPPPDLEPVGSCSDDPSCPGRVAPVRPAEGLSEVD